MSIEPLEVPERFDGIIKEQDLKDLEKRDRKTVLAMSQIEQWTAWQTGVLILQNQQLRQLEAQSIRDRREAHHRMEKIADSHREMSWQMSFAKWAAVTITAGIIAALLRSLMGKVL